MALRHRRPTESSGLIRAIYQRGLAGREPIPAFQRSDAMREREADPQAIMRNWGNSCQ